MTTPPDFGGSEIEEGLQEDLFGIAPEEHEGAGRDDLLADPHDENELRAAPAQSCARCGRPIVPGDEVRRRADGTWVHEVCPAPGT
jgi:PAS domain-containing protein